MNTYVSAHHPIKPPRLIYVMGPSGCGKDSLIRYARDQLSKQGQVQFAHRYITRDFNTGSENHIALTPAEFSARESAGLFAMSWSSHNYHYGIGIEINQWLAKDVSVVVNGSRHYLLQAQQRYPEMLPVCIEVSTEKLRERLIQRKRESNKQIEARMARNTSRTHASTYIDGLKPITINNDHALEIAGQEFTQLIKHFTGLT